MDSYELGRCYESAVETLLKHYEADGGVISTHERVLLVHGRPHLTREPYEEYGHAWLEFGNTVLDTETGKTVDKMLYYAVGNIREENCIRYTANMANWFLLEYENYGPWDGLKNCCRYGQEWTLNQIIVEPSYGKPRAVILRGLPGSGKTTALDTIRHKAPVICSPEQEMSPLIPSRKKVRMANAREACLQRFKASVARRAPLVVVDDYNLQRGDYLPFVYAALKRSYHVHIVEMKAPLKWCLAHNRSKFLKTTLLEMNQLWDEVPDKFSNCVHVIEKGSDNVNG